jgi:hypothetical protein
MFSIINHIEYFLSREKKLSTICPADGNPNIEKQNKIRKQKEKQETLKLAQAHYH